MALLKLGIIALITTILLTSDVFAAHPTSNSVRENALRALKACDHARAKFFADELKRVDPKLAPLYQLAWLEAPNAISPPASSQQSSFNTWSWKKDREIWLDEAEVSSPGCARSTDAATIFFSKFPSALIKSLLMPLLPQYESHDPGLREVIRKFALFEWLKGHRLSLPSHSSSQDESRAEVCEWRALQALHHGTEDQTELANLVGSCTSSHQLLWANFKTYAGDLLLKKGRADLAFEAFQSAVAFIPHHALPKALSYRIAVTGALSGASDDLVLRSAYLALTAGVDESESLPPLLKSSLENLVCSRLGELPHGDLMQTLRKVFEPKNLIASTLQLTDGCTDFQVGPLWTTLLKEVQLPRDQARVYGILLGSSIARRDPRAQLHYAKKLAVLSRKSPHAASRGFWAALQRAQVTPDHLISVQGIISEYKRSAALLPSDELRLKHLMRLTQKSKSIEPDSDSKLQMNAAHATPYIHLPIALQAAPLKFQGEIPTGFTTALEKAFTP